MAIDKKHGGIFRESPRQEFEVAYYTKELGRPLQRKMLERQLATLGDSSKAAHHEESVNSADSVPPPEDRAG